MNSIRNIVKRLKENRLVEASADYDKMDRDKLISLAQEGDQLAIEVLVNTHKDFLSKMSNKYIMDGSDQDDIEQLATIAFWDAINSYDPDTNGDFEAFAGMIIKRRLTDELRKDSAGKRQIHNTASSLDEPVASDDEGGESTLGATLSSDVSTEEEYLGTEGAKDIMRFMEESLSETELKAIKMKIAGYKISEIAEEMDMKYKSVENAIMRVKNKLADHMRGSYDESKKLKESEEIEFSEDEKKVLKSVISKIDENRKEKVQ